MVTDDRLLERARQENQVMAELVRLATSPHDYAEIVRSILDLVERLVISPILCLSVHEFGEVGHYARAGDDIDPGWAEESARTIAGVQEQLLAQLPGGMTPADLPSAGPMPWFRTFPAWTRSGRCCALALGAQEPLELSRDEEHLMRRLVAEIVLVLDHTLLLEQLEHLQTTDRLTNLANQTRLLDVLEYEMHRHRYAGKWLALLLLDVEGLDRINRSYGRQYGNHILRKLAVIIREAVRPIDLVARFGLDEFAVMLPETDEETAERSLEALRERLHAIEFAGGEVGVSAAVAHIKPNETLTPESFLRRAEQALYEAKRQQRGWSALLPSTPQRVR